MEYGDDPAGHHLSSLHRSKLIDRMRDYPMHKAQGEITDRSVLEAILRQGKYTVIALCRNREPYLVTLSYGYDAEKQALYFHTAQKGLKLDYLQANPQVCATVIEDRGYLVGECAHAYRSVVLFGKMGVVFDLQEKKYGMEILLRHLEQNPQSIREKSLPQDQSYARVAVLRLDIADMRGKAGQ